MRSPCRKLKRGARREVGGSIADGNAKGRPNRAALRSEVALLGACELRHALAERVRLRRARAVLRLEGGVTHCLPLGLAGLGGLDRRRLLGGRLGLALKGNALAERVRLVAVLAVLVAE